MTNRAFVLLGSNINKEQNISQALAILKDLCHVDSASHVYETIPVGLKSQPNFWNVAVLIETELDAASLRSGVLAEVEKRLKRVRTSDRNAPRTIDADLILFNEDILELDDDHHIPDPDLNRFAHVAVPIADLAPDMVHPETGETLKKLADKLMAESMKDGKPAVWRQTGVRGY